MSPPATATPQEEPADAPPPTSRPVGRAILRFALLVVILTAGVALLRWGPLAERLDAAELLATFRSVGDEPWAAAALIGAYVVLCPLGMPVSPLLLAGGVVFGFTTGTLLNFAGTWLGAATTFATARFLGRDLVVQLIGDRLARVERAVERHGFWTLVRLRFVPIPYVLVNYAAALAGVRPATYLTATAIGLAPAVALITYFADVLSHAAAGDRGGVLLQLGVAFLALFLLTFLAPRLLQRRPRT